MIDSKTRRAIDDYIKKIRKKLPESFETEDLLEDLEVHINEALREQLEIRPDEESILILEEVLENLGTPDEIAEEYTQAKGPEEEVEKAPFHGRDLIIRLFAAIVVVVIASWFVSQATQGTVDFVMAVLILMIFVLLEWGIRAWQLGETQILDSKIDEKRHR